MGSPYHPGNGNGAQPAVVDVTIIGAGPAGLAAAYYVGHREASCRIIESLEQLGGQAYVERMVEQGLQYGADVRLGESVRELHRLEVGGEEVWRLTTDAGEYLTRTIIITAGHGAFEPRKLPVPGLDDWLGRGLQYFVKRKADLAGKRCVIVGGGDSALDWTINLQDTAAKPIHLVHRRERFRGLESSQTEVLKLQDAGMARIHTPHELREIRGGDRIESVVLENTADGVLEELEADAVILQLGFISRLGPIADWGLEVVGKKQVRVDPTTFETALPNVFAAGDVAYYDNKITLITIGLGEAAIAANHCVARARGVKLQPTYSTE